MEKPDKIIKYYDGSSSFLPKTDQSGDKVGLVIDLETTGLDYNEDKIIEFGFAMFEYSSLTQEIIKVRGTGSFLSDPKQPLSEKIIKITGIKDEDLKDMVMPVDVIEKVFGQTDIVFAHNAQFDRNFCHNNFLNSREKLWICTKNDIDWKDKGFSSSALQSLCRDNGFYYDGHRAHIDCMATLRLMNCKDVAGNSYFMELLYNGSQKEVMVLATGAPFESKDILKNEGYAWNTLNKVWFKRINEDEASDLPDFMKNVYSGKMYYQVHSCDAKKRFLN
jgi:DNA polymerase-3 subunit epsilon